MKKVLAYLIVTLLFALILSEILLRVKDYTPFKQEHIEISMTPKWMYGFDSTLALKLQPGIYDIKELGDYRYKATIDSFGYRVSPGIKALLLENKNNETSRQIIFLGAGSTFGQGLSDTEAYVFVLQKLLPQYTFRNQAVMGFGVANNYNQIKNIKNYKKGDLVIYIYHSDQDGRYSLTNQKRALNFFSSNKNFANFHYLTIDSNLSTHLHKFNYKLWPLANYSSLINYCEDWYNNKIDRKLNYNSIARKAILDMNNRCNKIGLNFWVICWKSDSVSLETLNYLSTKGVRTFHIPVVIGFDHIPKKQIAPANKIFADSLFRIISNNFSND